MAVRQQTGGDVLFATGVPAGSAQTVLSVHHCAKCSTGTVMESGTVRTLQYNDRGTLPLKRVKLMECCPVFHPKGKWEDL